MLKNKKTKRKLDQILQNLHYTEKFRKNAQQIKNWKFYRATQGFKWNNPYLSSTNMSRFYHSPNKIKDLRI